MSLTQCDVLQNVFVPEVGYMKPATGENSPEMNRNLLTKKATLSGQYVMSVKLENIPVIKIMLLSELLAPHTVLHCVW